MNPEFILSIERTLLSTILYENNNINLFIQNGLTISDFYTISHAEIFKCMLSLFTKKIPVDEINILNENEKLDNKVLEQTLLEIISVNPISNPIMYIKTLKDFKLKKSIISKSTEIISSKENDNISGEELLSTLLSYLDNIKNHSNNLFSIKPLEDTDEKELEILCPNYLPVVKKTANLITARGDTGKTFLLLTLALIYQLNEIKNKTYKKCFCWFTEDDSGIIRKRRDELINSSLFTKEEQELLKNPKYKHLLQISDELPFHFVYKSNKNKFEIEEKFAIVKHTLKDFELVILDPLASFLGVNENDNSISKFFMNLMVHWAREDDKAVCLIHHTPHKEEKARGGESIRDTAKIHYFVRKVLDKEKRLIASAKDQLEIEIDKDNYNALKDFKKKFKLKAFPDVK